MKCSEIHNKIDVFANYDIDFRCSVSENTPINKIKSNDHECKATIFFERYQTLTDIIPVNLQPSLGTDSGVAVTVIEAVADVGVALALLEPKLF